MDISIPMSEQFELTDDRSVRTCFTCLKDVHYRATDVLRMNSLVLIINLLAACVAAVTVVGKATETEPAPRPNIIFILCDDLGYGDIGAFYQNERAAQHNAGVPFFVTPHIDTLARDGVKLLQHYCAAPVC